MATGETINEALQGERRKEERDLADFRKAQYSRALEVPAARFVLWDVIERIAGLHSETFVPDSNRSAFLQGRAAVGRDLMQQCQRSSPVAYHRMLEEANSMADALERESRNTRTAEAAPTKEID